MKLIKDNIVEYLIDMQLLNAGYQILFDEIEEQTFIRKYINSNWKWWFEYNHTNKQLNSWIKKATAFLKSKNFSKKEIESLLYESNSLIVRI